MGSPSEQRPEGFKADTYQELACVLDVSARLSCEGVSSLFAAAFSQPLAGRRYRSQSF
jgi:hypothetical protein